ncbi:hypothetical protein SAMN05444275_104238 [Myroides odoratimimus subsp. xuanwuensis]|nr:hypothetical protein SAMN05444275_104238 [Myroides odoratimimus subsp. xuanwuensis]
MQGQVCQEHAHIKKNKNIVSVLKNSYFSLKISRDGDKKDGSKRR